MGRRCTKFTYFAWPIFMILFVRASLRTNSGVVTSYCVTICANSRRRPWALPPCTSRGSRSGSRASSPIQIHKPILQTSRGVYIRLLFQAQSRGNGYILIRQGIPGRLIWSINLPFFREDPSPHLRMDLLQVLPVERTRRRHVHVALLHVLQLAIP